MPKINVGRGSSKRSRGGSKRSSSKKRRSVSSSRKSTPRPKIKSRSSGGSKRGRSAPASSSKPRRTGSRNSRKRLHKRSKSPFPGLPSAPQRGGVVMSPSMGGAGTIESVQQQQVLQLDNLRRRFASLESEAQLSDIYKTIGHLDSRLTALPVELDGLRRRGYVHAGQLEDRVVALDERWDQIRPRIEQTLNHHVTLLNGDIDQVRRMLGRGIRGTASAETAISGLSAKVSSARNALSGLYAGLDDQIDGIDHSMDRVDWMLDQFESAKFKLRDTEAPLAAAEAEWDRDGDEGPDGILFLTDQRLLFEQREQVTTKKIFGILATEKEDIQQFLAELEIRDIEQITDLEEKKGFLNKSKDEILEIVMNASAPMSRVRFQLLTQDSTAWGALVKRVMNGDIDEDRAEAYVAEVDEADAVMASFPELCPNCMAKLPATYRGATSLTCDYCNSVITPKVKEKKVKG